VNAAVQIGGSKKPCENKAFFWPTVPAWNKLTPLRFVNGNPSKHAPQTNFISPNVKQPELGNRFDSRQHHLLVWRYEHLCFLLEPKSCWCLDRMIPMRRPHPVRASSTGWPMQHIFVKGTPWRAHNALSMTLGFLTMSAPSTMGISCPVMSVSCWYNSNCRWMPISSVVTWSIFLHKNWPPEQDRE